MILKDIVEKLQFEVLTGRSTLECEVIRGYASDLLSDVMVNTQKGDLWVTQQFHHNIVAVAGMNELAGVVVVNGRRPGDDTIEKADIENVPIMLSTLHSFELIGRLYAMGVTGIRENAAGV